MCAFNSRTYRFECAITFPKYLYGNHANFEDKKAKCIDIPFSLSVSDIWIDKFF
jgi:hypothetical protein